MGAVLDDSWESRRDARRPRRFEVLQASNDCAMYVSTAGATGSRRRARVGFVRSAPNVGTHAHWSNAHAHPHRRGHASLGAVVVGVASPSVSTARTGPAVTKATCATSAVDHGELPAVLDARPSPSCVLRASKLRYPKTYRYDEIGIVPLIALRAASRTSTSSAPASHDPARARVARHAATHLEDGPGGLLNAVGDAAAQRARPRRDVRRSLATTTATCSAPRPTRWATTASRLRTSTCTRVRDVGPRARVLRRVPGARRRDGCAPRRSAIESAARDRRCSSTSARTPRTRTDKVAQPDRSRTRRSGRCTSGRSRSRCARSPRSSSDGDHAVGIMCSYGNMNGVSACLTPYLSDELDQLGVNALVRTDLGVERRTPPRCSSTAST